jgi:exodeoxyribonuclease V alpha subunit
MRATYQLLAGAAPPDLPQAATPGSARAPLQDALVVLERSHRFGTRPGIGALATASRLGQAAEAEAILDAPDYCDVQAQWDDVSGAGWLEPMKPWITALLATTTPEAALEALGRFRILCALREGNTGVVGINAAVERWLRRSGCATAGWYQHRPVLITANEPALQLYNGDVGILLDDAGEMRAWFPSEDGGVRGFLPSRLPAHETAWGMTIHKSQGSEFDHVLLVLPEQDTRVLTRELLYTAVTRAKVSVTVSGRRELLRRALDRTVTRTSGLVDRLR